MVIWVTNIVSLEGLVSAIMDHVNYLVSYLNKLKNIKYISVLSSGGSVVGKKIYSKCKYGFPLSCFDTDKLSGVPYNAKLSKMEPTFFGFSKNVLSEIDNYISLELLVLLKPHPSLWGTILYTQI
jgi:hypothetical protein